MNIEKIKYFLNLIDHGVDVLNPDEEDGIEPLDVGLLLERLEVLEAAVAWHGFDEEPMPLKGLEKLPRNHRHVRVVEFYAVQDAWGYEKKQIFKAEYHFSTEVFTVKGCTHSNGLPEIYRRCCKKAGHIGWRYPVGDLS